MILKPHLLLPFIGLVAGQGVGSTVGSTVGSALDTVGSTVDSGLDTVGSTVDTLGNTVDNLNVDTGLGLDTDLAVTPGGVNIGSNVGSGAGVSAAAAAAAVPAPADWKYSGCLTNFPDPSSWITYAPADTGTMTDELCTASCKPFRTAESPQVFAAVYSRPQDKDYCYCLNALPSPLSPDSCFQPCAASVTSGQCAASDKSNVYSVGPSGVEVRAYSSSVVEILNVKLCFVYNELEKGGSVFRGWGIGESRNGGKRLSLGNGIFLQDRVAFVVMCAVLCRACV